MEYGIHNYYVLRVEGEPYQAYDEEAVHVRVLNWTKVPLPQGEEKDESEEHLSYDLRELD